MITITPRDAGFVLSKDGVETALTLIDLRQLRDEVQRALGAGESHASYRARIAAATRTSGQ